jgi:2-polyprenyl-3-methyl-5-hydroxy-6-metoxy-1,4-benzoquinol methylase
MGLMNKCILCGTLDFKTIYEGPIRSGAWGQETQHSVKVIACESCGLSKLDKFEDQTTFYQSLEYRKQYNNLEDPQNLAEFHDHEQSPRIAKIGIPGFRNKTVLDYGCGHGSFLDSITGVANATYGIEPCEDLHQNLQARGHKTFTDVSQAKQELKGKVDVVVSFAVIEHVQEPLQHLQDISDLLKPNGVCYLETDNINSILMKLNTSAFERFFYRTAHLWYFNAETLNGLCKKIGFSNIDISFRHIYDLSNFVLWLKENQPTGLNKLNLFDERSDSAWKSMLEATGMGDLIFFKLTK